MNKEKYYCCVCGRQLVSWDANDDNCICSINRVFMGTNTYCCFECARDLDEDGVLTTVN